VPLGCWFTKICAQQWSGTAIFIVPLVTFVALQIADMRPAP
jgi:hypothetical protein